jgi:HK97 family phage prohead protease
LERAETREAGGEYIVEGYFSVYDSRYELWDGAAEIVQRGAFDGCAGHDARALWNHNDDIVLGRVSAGTLSLSFDERGARARIVINPDDTDAMNAYRRIQRGDCQGWSFGFDIEHEFQRKAADGWDEFVIDKVGHLYEVSPCVFPAYEATSIEARKNDLQTIKKRKFEEWKTLQLERLKHA